MDPLRWGTPIPVERDHLLPEAVNGDALDAGGRGGAGPRMDAAGTLFPDQGPEVASQWGDTFREHGAE